MSGEPDPLYVRARAALLDTLVALEPHLHADALDVLRRLRAVETEDLARRLGTLRASEIAGAVTNEAIALILTLFGSTMADGVLMAVRAAGDQEDSDTIAQSMVALIADLVGDPAPQKNQRGAGVHAHVAVVHSSTRCAESSQLSRSDRHTS